jgi:di/tricarboxylate transporter
MMDSPAGRARRLVAAGAVLLAALLVAWPPAALTPPMARAAGLALFSIGLWATGIVPEHVTTLAFFVLAMLGGAAPAPVVFSGFASSALWLIVGGLVLGASLRHTGLGERLAGRLAAVFPRSYAGVVGGTILVGLALAFAMPSSAGRVVLLVPVTAALAQAVGFERGSAGHTGLLLAAALGNFVPSFAILTANLPNMVLAGAAETQYGIALTYATYLLLHFPVLGALKALALLGLILLMFPDRLSRTVATPPARPLSAAERELAAVLAVSLALWTTDALHHVPPAWVSLAAGVWCLRPGSRLLPPRAFEQIGHGTVFFVAGILGLAAVVAHSGLGATLAGRLAIDLGLTPGAPARNFAGLAALSTLIGTVTTLPGVPGVLTPVSGALARAADLPVETVLMSQVLGFSTVILPYQAPPLILALHLSGVPYRAAAALCLALAAVSVLVLLPLDFLWWRLLGWI